jgi:hypothetical protein
VRRFCLTPGPTMRRGAELQRGRQIRNEHVVVAHVADVQVCFTSCRASTVLLLSKSSLIM